MAESDWVDDEGDWVDEAPPVRDGTGKVYDPARNVTETLVDFRLAGPVERGNTTGRQPATPGKTLGELDRGRAEADPGLFPTIGHQYLRGYYKGNADELAGKIRGATTGNPDLGTARRDRIREIYAASDEHRPKMSFAANVLGDVASDLTGAAFGAPVLSGGYQAAAGALRGFGDSTAETAGGQAFDTGLGATVSYGASLLPKIPGAVRSLGQKIEQTAPGKFIANSDVAKYFSQGADAVGDAVSSAAKPVGEALESAVRWPGEVLDRFAGRRATKAAGLIQKDLNKLPPEAADDIGRELLDRDLIRPGRTAEELRPGIEAARKEVGSEINTTLRAADDVSGGSGSQVRKVVRDRRQVDENLRAAEREAEAMYTDAAQSKAASDMAKRQARETALQRDALFEAGKYEEQTARHQDEVQDFLASLRSEAERTADGMGPAVEQEQKLLRKYMSLAEARQGDAPNRAGAAPALAAVAPKERAKAAAQMASEASEAEFGRRGTSEAYKQAGQIPVDVKLGRIPPVDPMSFAKGVGFDGGAFVEGVERRLMPELSDPILAPLKKQITTLLAGYRAKAANGISHAEANAWKTNVQKTIAKFQDAPVSQEAKIRLQGILDDEIERSIGSKLGPSALEGYQGAKRSYGLLKEANKGAKAAQKRDTGNRTFGMTELLLMGSGAGAGGSMGAALGGAAGGGLGAALGGPLFALGGNLARTRGSSAAAWGARGLATAYLDVVNKAPQLLGEFGAAIARQEGPEAQLGMTQALVMTNPKFAEMFEDLKQRLSLREASPDETAAR